MKYVYIAGPYRGRTHDYQSYCEIDANINQARLAAAALAEAGIGFFAPHLHSAHFEVIAPHATPEFWYELDMRFLEMCDAILLLPRWSESRGAKAELDWARAHGMDVLYSIAEAIEWATAPVL